MEEKLKLSNADFKLLSIVWDSEPVSSPELCRLVERLLGWKRTTTYTVLKRLCEKGLLQNEKTIVTVLVGREKVRKAESRQVLERSFDGSLPKFIAAFLDGGKISDAEAEQIKQMIDRYRRNT